jgi:hypothetical protein
MKRECACLLSVCLSVCHRRRTLREDVSAEDRQLQFASRLINVACFYRLLSIGIKFFEVTERFEQGDVVYGALLPFTEPTFMLLHFYPQEVPCWCH